MPNKPSAEDAPGSKDGNDKKPKQRKGKHKKSKIWQKLTNVKEKVKRLHNIIPWLRLVDCRAEKSAFEIRGVGTLHVGTIHLSVDTRLRNAVDRSRMFQYRSRKPGDRRPVEWVIGVRSALFTTERQEIEVLDHAVINVYGFLYRDVQGLRDASVSIKVGRVEIPYEDIVRSRERASKSLSRPSNDPRRPSDVFSDASDTDREAVTPSTEEERLLRTMSEAKDFVSSILRGIYEVSLAISSITISKTMETVKPNGVPVTINASLKEVGMDVYRLDPTTPAQSMYFSRSDIAHQALLSAISVSVGISDGDQLPERVLYIPMTTATVKTTLPAKLLQLASHASSSDRNANVFFANLVITSPSLDLDPRHLPILLALLANRHTPPSSRSSVTSHGKALVSRFLPKANIRLSIHEPVVRVALPTVEQKKPENFDFDLLIAAVSSITFDVDSEHSAESDVQYLLTSTLRISSHKLYYQTASRVRHDLLHAESLELRTQLTASPQVIVVASLNFQSFSMFMIRPEISNGVRHIMKQLRADVQPDKLRRSPSPRGGNLLRRMPLWLHNLTVTASDFNVEVAGCDPRLSSQIRGLALHLESFTADYKINKDDNSVQSTSSRKRANSRATRLEDLHGTLSPPPNLRKAAAQTDGRRMALHIRGFETFIIQGHHDWEATPFISLPSSEVSLTTLNDGYGPVLHVMVLVKHAYFQYSLFRHYCIGVAVVMLRDTFSRSKMSQTAPTNDPEKSSETHEEFIALDVKAHFVQIKAQVPLEPNLMLHIHGLEAEKHRWTTPFVKSSVVRFHCTAPAVKQAWNRLVSIKNLRLDLRELRRKQGSQVVTEKSFDVSSDAIRIGIPHQLIVHKIFDNIINTVKTVQQLHHRFKTRSDEYILAKHPEGPKQVPRVTIRTHVLLFELEDGAFEWKLGVIFRAGLIEQKQRLAREEAFRLKCRSMHADESRSSTNLRGKWTPNDHRDRSMSPPKTPENAGPHDRPKSYATGKKHMRYDRDGACNFSGPTSTSIGEAWEKLQTYNAQSWRKRVDRAMKTQTGAVAEMRRLAWGMDGEQDESLHEEIILQIPMRPALASLLVSDVNWVIDKPTFPLSQLPDFMHKVGKGLPKDTKFSLLVPLSAHFEMGEARLSLRDYPLPLLHIPAIKPGQSSRLPSWSLKADFVIGEEFRNFESTRDLQIEVIPAEKLDPGNKNRSGGFAVDVRRTVSAVKTYSEIKVEIKTARDTRFTWGTSYQPAIQDMAQVIEGFSKPQLDPSEKVGFWDKIRLVFHSRVSVAWTGGGDCHFLFKGSRDPYLVTGHGAGFVMVWRNNVCWNIRQSDDPTKFMTIDSGDYVLAIPDFSHEARQTSADMSEHGQGGSSISSRQDSAVFKKVVMKLSGKVQWVAGFIFERNLDDGGRSFKFEPHYHVTLKNPAHLKAIKQNPTYDAFRGFRSHHIHMSIGILAPSNRDWTKPTVNGPQNYNALHLTPRFFTHFFSWWSMFSGIMSLPIRQGRLFPTVEKSGKKFGRHLATIKYQLLLSPLFMSHVYKHKDAEDFSKSDDDTVSATGLKVRLDSFILDLHQRREEFHSVVQGLNKTVKTSGMRINRALLDLISADIRAVSARITGTSLGALKRASDDRVAAFSESVTAVDLSKFTIPDNDFTWIDVDDFVEIDWTLPIDRDPETKILPIAYAPRFTYRRQTDHNNTISGDPNRTSLFGAEDTHDCVMNAQSDSRQVQLDLVHERIGKIDAAMKKHTDNINEVELQSVRASTDTKAENQSKLDELHKHTGMMGQKKKFLDRMVHDLESRMRVPGHRSVPDPDELDALNSRDNADQEQGSTTTVNDDSPTMDANTMADHISDFNNRFVIHNAQIKWNNSLRDIMLRYIHQVSQRRGFVYYTSRRAVKFILDIVEEQQAKATSAPPTDQPSEADTPTTPMSADDSEIQDRIKQLLQDGRRFVAADDEGEKDKDESQAKSKDNADQNVSHDFIVQNTYHVRLVAPQIQLQSEKNQKSAVLITARGMRLKVFQIMDKDRVSDDVSGLVQRRFAVEMDNMQFFVTTKQRFSPEFLHMYTGNNYGTYAGKSWPPWVPIEVMFDFQVEQYGFARIVERTSASLRLDKYNKLRLKYNENVSDGKDGTANEDQKAENRMDHLWVDFPQLRAICDSSQYFAMYIIVMDLLLYQEPLEKTRDERLEKIMLASDFSDLRGAPELVSMLQERIRQLEELKTHFHVNEKYLDRQGWADRITLDQDLTSCEDELFFMMKAITTSQQKRDERKDDSQASGLLRYYIAAKEIVWHLVREQDTPLVEFQLANASFERQDNSDGSNFNAVEIDRIQGLNLLENAIYPEMLAPYLDPAKPIPSDEEIKMLSIKWHMLEAIAGIPVVDHFEVNTFPLKLSLEYEIGHKLFEYVFPGARDGKEEGFSPFMVRTHGLRDQSDDNENDTDMNGFQSEAQRTKFLEESSKQTLGSATGAGQLGQRLQPTHRLPDASSRPSSSYGKRPKSHGLGITHNDSKALRLHQTNASQASNMSNLSSDRRLSTRASAETIGSNAARGREMSKQSSSNAEGASRKRFGIRRSQSGESRSSKTKKSDDLSQMLSRASNYMTLSYAKVSSVVLCLSYRGKGSRNIEDVHDLVFRMPTLEYRNKTWSNLDLALALKKDVIRALISHTGAIIGNKLSHHKPGKTQASRLRELATSSIILGSSGSSSRDVSKYNSAANSIRGANGRSSEDHLPRTPNLTVSTNGSEHADSYADSIYETTEIGWSLGDSRPSTSTSASRRDGERETTPGGINPLRSTLTRHFSELASKAKRSNSLQQEADGTADTADGDVDDAASVGVTRRTRLVRKILHPMRESSS